jgi:hypothetical protein
MDAQILLMATGPRRTRQALAPQASQLLICSLISTRGPGRVSFVRYCRAQGVCEALESLYGSVHALVLFVANPAVDYDLQARVSR